MTVEAEPEKELPPCERCGGDGIDQDQTSYRYSDDPETPNPCRNCYWFYYYGDEEKPILSTRFRT